MADHMHIMWLMVNFTKNKKEPKHGQTCESMMMLPILETSPMQMIRNDKLSANYKPTCMGDLSEE